MTDRAPTHDALRSSLAAYVRSMTPAWIVLEEMTLGSSQHANGDPAQRRLYYHERHTGVADVWALRVSWSAPCTRIFEVKASRSDLLADLRAEKWRSYLPHCNQLVWALPEGLADARELPPSTGLIVLGPRGWRARRYGPDRGLEYPLPGLVAALFATHRDMGRLAPKCDPFLGAQDA